jgi:hypothetical protein
MRRFIEIIKEQTEAQIANGEPQEQIRVEVADETGPEIIDRIAALRAGAGWTAETRPPGSTSAITTTCRRSLAN